MNRAATTSRPWRPRRESALAGLKDSKKARMQAADEGLVRGLSIGQRVALACGKQGLALARRMPHMGGEATGHNELKDDGSDASGGETGERRRFPHRLRRT